MGRKDCGQSRESGLKDSKKILKTFGQKIRTKKNVKFPNIFVPGKGIVMVYVNKYVYINIYIYVCIHVCMTDCVGRVTLSMFV